MGEEILTFDDIEIEKLLRYKSPIYLEYVDMGNISESNKISSGEKNCKYFNGYWRDDYKIKLLQIILLTSTYVKSYDGQAKWMCVLIKDDDLLGKYNASWDKISSDKKLIATLATINNF